MANYRSLEDAIAAGTSNMINVRNNNPLTNSIDDFPCPVDWFIYNGELVEDIYYSGSAYLGFGRAGEDLRVNGYVGNSDVRYIWYEIGTLVQYNFLKIRWHGFTRASFTSSIYLLVFDVYILDNGNIVLDIISNESSSTYFTGNKFLQCGSENVPITIAAGNTGEWTFEASDTINGIDWSLENGWPYLTYVFELSGSVKFELSGLLGIKIVDSEITWDEILEEGTSVIIKKSFDDVIYTQVISGDVVANKGTVLSNDSIYLLVEMSTSIPENTPTVSNLYVMLRPTDIEHSIILEMMPLERFESTKKLTVQYDGAGGLGGIGGPVPAFSEELNPEDLVFKGDQNAQEHIELTNVIADGDLIKVDYIESQTDEKIELSNIIANGTLTHIDDL